MRVQSSFFCSETNSPIERTSLCDHRLFPLMNRVRFPPTGVHSNLPPGFLSQLQVVTWHHTHAHAHFNSSITDFSSSIANLLIHNICTRRTLDILWTSSYAISRQQYIQMGLRVVRIPDLIRSKTEIENDARNHATDISTFFTLLIRTFYLLRFLLNKIYDLIFRSAAVCGTM